jgi:hypothetical protein
MPYYKAAGSHILHFGEGDIRIAHGCSLDRANKVDNEIVFVLGKPGAIGRDSTAEPGLDGEVDESVVGLLSSDVDAPVRLIFETVASLDVLMDQLGLLREKMLASEPAQAE